MNISIRCQMALAERPDYGRQHGRNAVYPQKAVETLGMRRSECPHRRYPPQNFAPSSAEKIPFFAPKDRRPLRSSRARGSTKSVRAPRAADDRKQARRNRQRMTENGQDETGGG